MQIGDKINLDCFAENVRHFYGIAFHVLYDPNYFEISSGGSIESGEILNSYAIQKTFAPIEGQNGFVVGVVIDKQMNVNDAPDIITKSPILSLKSFLKAIKSGTTHLEFESYTVQRPDLSVIDVNWSFPTDMEIYEKGIISITISEGT